jgi:plastocyanin
MHLLLVSALGSVVLLVAGVVSGLAAEKTIEATGGAGNYNWAPETATINVNGGIEFKNTQSIPHGLVFESPPATPNCGAGVPVNSSMGNWSGECTFTQPGTYNFHCYVHPVEMTGTVTVTGAASPSVTTEPATAVKATEATLNGKVNPAGKATTYWFNWGTNTGYGNSTAHVSAGSGSTSIPESATISGLTAATVYHFQIVGEYESTEIKGADRSFTTAGPPTATTDLPSGVGPVGATLKGTINPKGLETEYFFEYGLTSGYGQETTVKHLTAGTSNVAVSEPVIGLLPETEYHYRVVAENSASTAPSTGVDRTFTTTGGPVATTGQATEIGETSAKLGGTVNPQGQATKYFFNYGTTTGYGQKTAEISAGSGSGNVSASQQLTGLSPGTTYHFQLVAKNAGGETRGLDGSFTTESTPPPPPPPPPPAPPLPAPAPLPPPTPSPVPDTTITGKPPAKTHDRTPTIKFKASVGGASFQCSVDSKPFKACRSPYTAPSLKPGRHRLRVKAIAGGAADPTPASVSFKVVAAKKK